MSVLIYSIILQIFILIWQAGANKEGLKGCSKFLYNHSAEEHTHLEKFREFINKAGGQAVMG